MPLFRLRHGFTIPPWPRFQPPPRQTQRADFPHCAFLLASHQGLWDLSGWERFRHLSWALHPVVLEQTQVLVKPLPTPPLPAEAPPLPCTHQMTPDFLFHPVFHKAKTPARIPYRKIAHPAPQDRVNELNHPTDRLGLIPAKNLLTFPLCYFDQISCWLPRDTP